MFSRKNTVIIAIIAIFVLGSVILHADIIDIQVRNVYSHVWSHAPLEVITYELGSSTPYRTHTTGNLNNLPSSTYTFEDLYYDQGGYDYTVTQGNRTVSGQFWLWGQWGVILKSLPGPYEPIPRDPPVQD